MSLPVSNEEYGSKQYWQVHRITIQILESDGSFDWFKSYADIQDLLAQFIPNKGSRILMLGCGNSKLSEQMYDDGYRNIVNIDYSATCIQQMRERHASRPEMEWHEMDIRELQFEDNSFDVALDKGTMDAMMTSKGDVWDPPQEVIENCTKEVDEVLRVLRKPAGTFLYLTFGQPHFRKRFLAREGTTLQVKELGEAFHYYFYILHT
ncbi:S-adenosyl-L-methionine-dependent methyltransferase, partial [Mycena floridula]